MSPSVAVARDGVTLWNETGVTVIDFDANELFRIDAAAPDSISAAALSNDGRALAIASYRGALEVYEID